MIGCDVNTITNWENGRRSPTISHTAKIAEFLRYIIPTLRASPSPTGWWIIGKLAGCGRQIWRGRSESIQVPLPALSAANVIQLKSIFPGSRQS